MIRKISLLIFCCSFFPLLYADNAPENNTLTFAQAAELAVLASVDLRHARASSEIMNGAWKWGLRVYFPRVGITASENDRLQQIGSDSFIKNYGISLDQLIWDGGRTSMSRKLERIELDFASARLDRMSSDIAESAISAYRSLLSQRAILEIKKSALTILEEQRRILNEEVLLGLALPVDLASADISLADSKLDIYSLELDLTELEKKFKELLGLDELPVLTEKVDLYRSITLPAPASAASLAREQNPEILEAQFSITKRQEELKFISNSWIPTLRLNGNFGLSGQHYPLTRYNWSLGINIEFSSPWFQNRLGAQTGWEPSTYRQFDRTAMVQNSFTPLPDPSAKYGVDQARLTLALEQERYQIILEQIGRIASNTVEKYALVEQKRLLALEAAALGSERIRIEEIRMELGHITRLRLMEVLIEQTQKEIAVIEAATALLEIERELERLLDLPPGELKNIKNTRSYL